MVLLILAGGLRLIWLDHIPTNITADEADNLKVVIHIKETGKPGLFGLDWKPAPAFSMYLAREFMRVFGDTPFGLRTPSALFSTLALIPFYALARRVVSPAAALTAAALLATGRWYLHFSRSGWENVHTAFFALLATWTLTVALEKGDRRWFGAAGAAATLGLYGYFVGRLILLALLAYAPLAWWWSRRRKRRLVLSGRAGPVVVETRPIMAPRRQACVLPGFALMAATAVLLYLPQLRTIQKDWDYFNKRTNAVSVFNQPRPYLGETTALGILSLQLERTVAGYLLLDGSLFNNGQYSPPGKSIVDPATGLLFLGGLVLSLWWWRATALWWIFLFMPLLATQVLTANTPDAARAVIVAPFIYLFVALAIDAALKLAAGSFQQVAHVLLVIGVVVIAAVNVTTYFRWITSPTAAEVREPGVEYSDYPRWLESLRCGLRGGALGVTTTRDLQCVHLAGDAASAPSRDDHSTNVLRLERAHGSMRRNSM